ncbi:UDP-N-acetylmuramate dehydrogenase [Verticiella sediminum]|uniref:UDP-N-acetylenolpyruvoylglucosamine reductase n=1 Tax=Verticiella sediminum TaxID=1247510 RepID=A0A556ACE1_9BURK|nr:UDP-N-acetylmuramate dehydrogenase [Verticiella sediminum]TSH90548.1 UDP-N-acetylmuramate dehydrogenase [Verticiella sediminum]
MPLAAVSPALHDLSRLNTLALQAHARTVVALDRLDAVERLFAQAPAAFVLGGGSNVVLPRVFPGTVALIRLAGIRRLPDDAGDVIIEAAAGESWHGFVAHCVAQGWGGLENLALIPGTVGAAPVQNIGAYGVEVCERLESVTAYDRHAREWVRFTSDASAFAYRDSRFKREPGRWLITAVRFRLPSAWTPRLSYPDLRERPEWRDGAPTPQAVFDAVCAIRRAKLPDPAQLPNAGSFFKNPIVPAALAERLRAQAARMPAWPLADGRVKLAAGWLIEQAGWKGRRLGRVGMHERHALVLVNYGGAERRDVQALADAVVADVAARFGVMLEAEPVQVPAAG